MYSHRLRFWLPRPYDVRSSHRLAPTILTDVRASHRLAPTVLADVRASTASPLRIWCAGESPPRPYCFGCCAGESPPRPYCFGCCAGESPPRPYEFGCFAGESPPRPYGFGCFAGESPMFCFYASHRLAPTNLVVLRASHRLAAAKASMCQHVRYCADAIHRSPQLVHVFGEGEADVRVFGDAEGAAGHANDDRFVQDDVRYFFASFARFVDFGERRRRRLQYPGATYSVCY